MMCVKLIKEID